MPPEPSSLSGEMVLLYLDQHVKRAVAVGLRARGVDVVTCFGDGTDRMPDEELLVHVHKLGRTIFTQDADFLALGDRWIWDGREFSGIDYGSQRASTVGQTIGDLELIAKTMNPAEMTNLVIHLPL